MEEDPFVFDIMARTVSAPSQSTVHLADKTPWDLYYECLDKAEAWQFSTPNLLDKIDMQARYAVARATVLKYTLPVPISKKGSTKCTLCGIVSFKLNTFLVMFLHVPSIDSTCLPCT